MKQVIQKVRQKLAKYLFTRAEIAEWYGLKQSGLSARLRAVHLSIKNRSLTVGDAITIFKHLGFPLNCPIEIIAIIKSFNFS